MLVEAAALITQISGEVIPSNVPGSLALATRQAAGVVLSMAPWNAPVILGVRAVATSLACGNTVVLKGSEHPNKCADCRVERGAARSARLRCQLPGPVLPSEGQSQCTTGYASQWEH